MILEIDICRAIILIDKKSFWYVNMFKEKEEIVIAWLKKTTQTNTCM